MILSGLTLGLFDPRPDLDLVDKEPEQQKKAAQIDITGKTAEKEERRERMHAFLPFTTAFRPFL